jgi:hypothetical protein
MKWIKLIRFINKHRKMQCSSFEVLTTGDTFIIYPNRSDKEDVLRLKYKGWTP